MASYGQIRVLWGGALTLCVYLLVYEMASYTLDYPKNSLRGYTTEKAFFNRGGERKTLKTRGFSMSE